MDNAANTTYVPRPQPSASAAVTQPVASAAATQRELYPKGCAVTTLCNDWLKGRIAQLERELTQRDKEVETLRKERHDFKAALFRIRAERDALRSAQRPRSEPDSSDTSQPVLSSRENVAPTAAAAQQLRKLP